MGKRKYLSKFNPDWFEMDQFKSWLKIVKEDDTAAYCNTCMSKFDVGNREKKLRHDKLSRQFFVSDLSNLVVILVGILVAKAIPAKKPK